MNGDVMEGGMHPDLWELQKRILVLEQLVAGMRRELDQHYSNHQVAANRQLDARDAGYF